MLIRALEEAGVDYSDLDVRLLFPHAARVAFMHGEVDAWALGDPTLADVQQSMPVRVVRDGRGLVSNPKYYLANRSFAESCPELIQIFHQELTNAQTWVREHIDQTANELAPIIGIAREAIDLSLRRSLPNMLDPEESIASQQRLADTFYALNLIPRAVNVAEETHWVKALH